MIYLDWNNINTNRDTSGLGPIEYNQKEVPALVRKHADYVREKTYGQDVRESLARGIEYSGLVASEAVNISNETKERQDNVETQFNSVQQELTDKDVISAPEIIAARGGESTLSARLDKEQQEVTTQLAQNKQQTHNKFHRQKIRPIVSFLADDGGVPDYTKLKPLAEDYGIPFTLALITSHGIFLEENRHLLRELVDDYGFEVASHTRNHVRLSTLTPQEQEEELRLSKQDIEEAGFDVNAIVYPFSDRNADTLDIVPKYYKAGYRAGTNTLNDSPIDTYNLGRIQFDPTNKINELWWYKRQVDEAIRDRKWVIFMLHTDTRTEVGHWLEGDQIVMLRELIEYIQSKNVEIMTCGDAFEVFENVYETLDGEYQIGVKSRPTDEHVGGIDTNSKKPDWYKNKATRHTVLTYNYMEELTGNDAFPTKEPSLLTTTRSDDFVSQTLYSRDGNIYFRTGVENVWGKWKRTEEYVGGIDTNSKVPDWYPNQATRHAILGYNYMQSLTGAEKFPTTEPALLSTTRSDDFAKQTLFSRDGSIMFRVGIENKWGKWVNADRHVGGEVEDTNVKPPHWYPNDATQHTKLSYAYLNSLEGADAFPTKEPGMLTTTRSDDYVTQTLHSRDGKVYFRTGIGSKWHGWSVSTPL